jgi:hypothetical protein
MAAGPGESAPDGRPTGLHPAFRILLLLVLAGMLFRYSLAALVLVLAVLLAAAAAGGGGALGGILRALRRIRWLLLSIVVIFLWIAPEPALADQPWYLPAWSDLELALRRAGVLVVLVAAVELLRRHTPASHLAAALVQLLRPLSWLGVETGVFARRLALTLDAVPLTAERVAQAAGERRIRRGLGGWGEAAAGLVREIESGAVAASREVALPELGRASARDWLWLAAGVALCLALGRL